LRELPPIHLTAIGLVASAALNTYVRVTPLSE